MAKKINSLRQGFYPVEDQDGNGYVLDFNRYPTFLDDDDATAYEIYAINEKGDVAYDNPITFNRGELKPKGLEIR